MDDRWASVINQRLIIFCIMKDYTDDGEAVAIDRFKVEFSDRKQEIQETVRQIFKSNMGVEVSSLRNGFGETAISHCRVGTITVQFESDQVVQNFPIRSHELVASLKLNPVHWHIARTFY